MLSLLSKTLAQDPSQRISSAELWARNGEADGLIYQMMRDWEERQLDAVITCPFPVPAFSNKYSSALGAGQTST